MNFNSIDFFIFFILVFFSYWSTISKHLKIQNLILLASSYFFYACWDWRFLFLLIFSTLLDYFTGIKMSNSRSNHEKKAWFWLSICINIGFLGVFKYFNFFANSFADLISNFGLNAHTYTLNIILPVGISFYTFHGLSYVIDIYNDRIKPEKSFVNYAVFVSFFPLLVAGPIERATHLLPQIKGKRDFEYEKAVDGLKQILWGLFKKVVIADNFATIANAIFENHSHLSSSTLVLGAVAFSFQIYGDFSGYSDMALGTAKLFGINLMRNFANPYFSRDIAEFWRRWHISLSSWFRDYLYIPLGGSSGGMWRRVKNTFIIFIVSGFWHGANWTFIVWGILNAFFIMPSIIFQSNRKNLDVVAKARLLPTLNDLVRIGFTFCLTTFAWIFFRSENITHALEYISGIFKMTIFSKPYYPNNGGIVTRTLVLALFFIVIEWQGREQQHALETLFQSRKKYIRYAFYYLVIIIIFVFSGSNQQFIYFQF